MTNDESIKRIGERFAEKLIAAPSDQERLILFVDFVQESAAARARSVYLLLETEAERHIAEEDPKDLASRLQVSKVLAGIEFAQHVGESLKFEHTAIERGAIELHAARAYEAEFVRLLNTAGVGGSA